MKRLLLTGVGGSIGCHALVHFLHNTNWEIIGIDSFRHKGLTDRVTQVLHKDHPEYLPRVDIYTHDLTVDISSLLERKIGHIDYIVNMASRSDVHDSLVDPVSFVIDNTHLILKMLEYARRVKPEVFLQISTDEVYGPTNGTYLHEEWSSILPSNPYSASKAAQEAIAISYQRSYGVPLVLVNLMNNFGEMQSPSKFPAIVQRKVRKGETIDIHVDNDKPGSRWYIHSRNSADALLFILRNVYPKIRCNVARPDRFNIVGDRQIDNLELARMIAALIGKPLRYRTVPVGESRPGHDIHYGLDGTKLTELGWKSHMSLEESMKRTVQWYEENPEWLEAR